jgi:hypothetical protein
VALLVSHASVTPCPKQSVVPQVSHVAESNVPLMHLLKLSLRLDAELLDNHASAKPTNQSSKPDATLLEVHATKPSA